MTQKEADNELDGVVVWTYTVQDLDIYSGRTLLYTRVRNKWRHSEGDTGHSGKTLIPSDLNRNPPIRCRSIDDGGSGRKLSGDPEN